MDQNLNSIEYFILHQVRNCYTIYIILVLLIIKESTKENDKTLILNKKILGLGARLQSGKALDTSFYYQEKSGILDCE